MNLSTIFFTTNNKYMLVIILIVLVITVLAALIANKFGIKFINTTKSIVQFVSDTLVSLNIESGQVSVIEDLILQAIAYAIAINGDSSIDTKASDALLYIKDLASKLGVALTDQDIVIISEVLKIAFAFITSLNIRVTSITKKKLIKYNAKLMK